MISIAITGGVATGKSTVSTKLAELWGERAAFFSADAAVHELLTRPEIKRKIGEVFGSGIFDGAGEIDRASLRQVVFRDPSLRRTLEEILHPEVFTAGRNAFTQAVAAGRQMFVYEIPLLYEVESPQQRDFDLVVAASEEIQRLRMREKRRLDPETIDQILNAQMPIARKVERADIVIWNDSTEAELDEQIFLLSGRLHPSDPEAHRPEISPTFPIVA